MQLSFIAEKQMKLHKVAGKSGLIAKFMENGSPYVFERGKIMINLFAGRPFEGAVSNIYLRVFKDNKILYAPLIGPGSHSKIRFSKTNVCYEGVFAEIGYRCIFSIHPSDNVWYWSTEIHNLSSIAVQADIIYIQDLGILDRPSIQRNEAYTSHYIDHRIFRDRKYGYVVCSRQNLECDGGNPLVMIGSSCRTTGFVTDGFQFYGLSFKENGRPALLEHKDFPNKVLQYEFACPALKTKILKLQPGKTEQVVFYGCFVPDHPAVSSPKDLLSIPKIIKDCPAVEGNKVCKIIPRKNLFSDYDILNGETLSLENLKRLFPGDDFKNLEYSNGDLLSFFHHKDSRHVVLKDKELLVRRPHGNILRSGNSYFYSDQAMSSTNYMFGVFHSHITIGNSAFNKLTSVLRSHLNIFKSQGLRIFIKNGKKFLMLGLPSAYEMGTSFSRWIYQYQGREIIVQASASETEPKMNLSLKSSMKSQFVITSSIVLGGDELEYPCTAEIDDKNASVTLQPSVKSSMGREYPGSLFKLICTSPDKVESIGGDEIIWSDSMSQGYPVLAITTKMTNSLLMEISGTLVNIHDHASENLVSAENHFWQTSCNRIALSMQKKNDKEILKLDSILPWFIHNAIIHFTSLHGLEQYCGAAWGTRDVSQGPVELFLALGKNIEIRKLLKMLFANQFDDGEWPQWFMNDKYGIRPKDSHGDVIIWPLKALCDYIEFSADFSILELELPYVEKKTFQSTPFKQKLFQHVEKIITHVMDSFIKGTFLMRYGGGDWNDSLQPASQQMKDQMVSSWTVALLFQTLSRFAVICCRKGLWEYHRLLTGLCENIKSDFNKFLIRQETVAGFGIFNSSKKPSLLIHPADKKSGIKYRLLPMTRGIISEIFTKKQAKHHFSLIKKYLRFPDGARLMDYPVRYQGGITENFCRAEQSAFFGREIGVHYTHAHIRYIEACAKLGMADELYAVIKLVNPIGIQEILRNAMPRQSNCFYSSSDADFNDRYEAQNKYSDLKSGKIPLSGGWRIYSSGPGIFLNQLVSNFFGIRYYYDKMVFDPVIPRSLDGLVLDLMNNKFTYHINHHVCGPEKIIINGVELTEFQKIPNPYRRNGIGIPRHGFLKLMNLPQNNIDIFL